MAYNGGPGQRQETLRLLGIDRLPKPPASVPQSSRATPPAEAAEPNWVKEMQGIVGDMNDLACHLHQQMESVLLRTHDIQDVEGENMVKVTLTEMGSQPEEILLVKESYDKGSN